MALFCIIFKAQRDVGWKTRIFHSTALHMPPQGWPELNFAMRLAEEN